MTINTKLLRNYSQIVGFSLASPKNYERIRPMSAV